MLRDLKTNFRSLKFDNNGGKTSPYIVTPLENLTSAQKYRVGAAGTSIDFPLRGGSLAIINSALDLERISKFLLDAPRGPIFIAKQVGLQLSNPKIETGTFLGIENTRLYNLGINTLAQVPVNAFGVHFDRSGILPIMAENRKYETIVRDKNKNTPNQNRLVTIYNDKIVVNASLNTKINNIQSKLNKFTSTPLGKLTNAVVGGNLNTIVQRSLNPKYFVIDSYIGGPNSFLGIGTTTINRFDFTPGVAPVEPFIKSNQIDWIRITGEDLNNVPGFFTQQNDSFKEQEINDSINLKKQNQSLPNSHLNSISFNYDLLAKQESLNPDSLTKYKDFRETINTELGGGPLSVINSTNYSRYNMMSRIGIGNPGKIGRDRRKISIEDKDTQDKINMLPLFKEEINEEAGGTVVIPGVGTVSARDLIKFRFEAVDNDNPSRTIKIVFRAFVSNLADHLGAEWTAHRYTGRGENFYTYQGFNRTFSLDFKIFAQSRSEMKPLYQKLNYLMTNLTPDYSTNGFMRGPFMLFTLGNYFFRTPVIINHLNINIDDQYAWEIAMDAPESGEDLTMTELPQLLNVNLGITPIHNFIPRKGPTVPLINTGTRPTNSWLAPSEFNRLS